MLRIELNVQVIFFGQPVNFNNKNQLMFSHFSTFAAGYAISQMHRYC